MNRKLANMAASGLALVMMTSLAVAPGFAEARDRDSQSGSNRGGGNRERSRAETSESSPPRAIPAPRASTPAAQARPAPQARSMPMQARPESNSGMNRQRPNDMPAARGNDRPGGGQDSGQWRGGNRPDRPSGVTTRPDRGQGGAWNGGNGGRDHNWNNGSRPDHQGGNDGNHNGGGRPGGNDNHNGPRPGQGNGNWNGGHNGSHGGNWNGNGGNHNWNGGGRPHFDYHRDNRFYGYSGIRYGYYFAPSYGYYRVPNQWYGHRWTSGEYLPDYFFDYRIYDYLSYGLPTPPYDCAYYFVGRDVVLVDQSSGEIIDVFYDVY